MTAIDAMNIAEREIFVKMIAAAALAAALRDVDDQRQIQEEKSWAADASTPTAAA